MPIFIFHIICGEFNGRLINLLYHFFNYITLAVSVSNNVPSTSGAMKQGFYNMSEDAHECRHAVDATHAGLSLFS